MRTDHAAALHLVDQPSGTGIAQAQLALQQRHGRLARIQHYLDRLREHLVGFALVLVVAAVCGALSGGARLPLDLLNHLVVIFVLRLLGALQKLDHRLHLGIADIRALHTHRLRQADRHKQHIAVAEQLVRAARVQNGAGVDTARHRQRQTTRDVRLDKTGDDVDRRALGRNDEVHPRRARHLRQPHDGILHLVGGSHHQVGQLVDHNEDLRLRLQRVALPRQLVIRLQIAHVVVRKRLVTCQHFRDRPAERTRRLARVGHDRHEQVRNAVVDAELHLLRVDEQQAHLFGRRAEQHALDHRVGAHGFTRAGRARNEQVGHFREVGEHDLARNVAPERDRQLGFCHGELGRVDQLAQPHHRAVLVRNLDAHRRLVRDGRLNAHAGRGEAQGDVVCQPCNAAELYTGARLQFIARDRRTARHVDHLGAHAEIVQRFDEQRRRLLLLLPRLDLVVRRRLVQQRHRRVAVAAAVAALCGGVRQCRAERVLLRLRRFCLALVRLFGFFRLFGLFCRLRSGRALPRQRQIGCFLHRERLLVEQLRRRVLQAILFARGGRIHL